jgi:hypothetical protein
MRGERRPWAGKGGVLAKESRFFSTGIFLESNDSDVAFLRLPLHSVEIQERESLIRWSDVPRRALIGLSLSAVPPS